jgi:hypothetical protein
VTDAIYTDLPQQDGEFTAAGIDALLTEVKKTLSAELRKNLVTIASELSASDGTDSKETDLIGKVRRALA